MNYLDMLNQSDPTTLSSLHEKLAMERFLEEVKQGFKNNISGTLHLAPNTNSINFFQASFRENLEAIFKKNGFRIYTTHDTQDGDLFVVSRY